MRGRVVFECLCVNQRALLQSLFGVLWPNTAKKQSATISASTRVVKILVQVELEGWNFSGVIVRTDLIQRIETFLQPQNRIIQSPELKCS